MFSVLKGFRHGFAWIFLEGQLGFADVSLKRDIYEEHLTSLDPRRAAEECGEFPTALDARSDAKGRRVLKREPTGGAPTGAYGRAARFGAAGLGTHKGCPYGGGGGRAGASLRLWLCRRGPCIGRILNGFRQVSGRPCHLAELLRYKPTPVAQRNAEGGLDPSREPRRNSFCIPIPREGKRICGAIVEIGGVRSFRIFHTVVLRFDDLRKSGRGHDPG